LTTLSPNIENRVRKLPKPSSAAQGLLPLFEAVSNAFFAIDDRSEVETGHRGRVDVTVNNLSNMDKVQVVVKDNGVGLDDARFSAFCEVDTDFKSEKGGKGVGRLYWLDAFSNTAVSSRFKDETGTGTRAFQFELSNSEQIKSVSLDADAASGVWGVSQHHIACVRPGDVCHTIDGLGLNEKGSAPSTSHQPSQHSWKTLLSSRSFFV